jgi:uncharacterized protein (DUF2141 family)
VRHLGICTIALLALAVNGWAQAVHDVTITGTVTTSSGERVPGVTVMIKSPALVTGERQVISDQEGRFVFLSLPPGRYALTAELQGFNKFSTPDIVLHSGEKTDVKVALRPAAYQEQVTVTAAAPVVDTKSSTVSTTFTSELLEKLPTARNAFYDLAMGAPGMASVGGNESWLSSPSAYGSAANENIFLVNGVNATNPRGAPWGTLVNVNYNTVEEVKIISLGSKAEYGSFSGAAIDVLTKSGSNDFRGDVAYYSQIGNAANNATLNFGGGANPYIKGERLFYADPADVLTTKPKDQWEGSATFGGPILRDRLWFYAGYNKAANKVDTPLWQPLHTWNQALYDIKLTGDFASNHRAWIAYHNEKIGLGNETWGPTWDPTMGYDQNQNNNTMQAQYQWVINDRNLASAKYLGFRTNQNPKQLVNSSPGFINWWKWTNSQSIGLGGSFPYVESYKSSRKTVQADMTHYAAHFLGEHEVKFGVQYTKSQGNFEGGYFQGYANFAYPYPWDYGPAKDWWWNSGYWGTKENPVFPIYNIKYFQHPWLTRRIAQEGGGFIDDTWSVNDRLTFNVGARYDRMSAKYGEGAIYQLPQTPDDIANPTLLRTRKGTGNIFDFKTFSPRLGLAYTLTEDRRTVLRAHAGRYFAPLGVESLRRFGPDMEKEKREMWMYLLPMSQVDLNHNGLVDFNEVRPAYRLMAGRTPDKLYSSWTSDPSWSLEVDPGTKSPYTDQFELSLQRQLGRDYSVEGTAIYKRSKNFIALRPYNKATGAFFEWTSKPFTTFTGFKTKGWEIVMQDYNGDGKLDIDDAKFVMNNIAYRAVNVSEFDGQSVHRDYQGLQLVFTKRYSSRWQGLGAVNYNHSSGIAPRMLDQNWYIDGPMIMDTPFGTSYNDYQNNLNGPSLMTPKLMVKLNGSYTIPVVEADFGLRWRYDNGRPFWPIQNIPTFATWMSSTDGVFLTGNGNSRIVAADVKHPDYMPATSIFDVSIGKTIKAIAGTSVFISLDVLNATNENSPNIIGFGQGDYGRVYSIVQPRTYRAGVKLMF